LETLVGTAPQFQQVELQDPSTGSKKILDEETKTLNDFEVANHQILHVIDTDPSKYVASTQQGEVTQPFELSAEKEAARAEVMKQAKEQKAIADDQKLLRAKVGDRVQVVGGPAGSAPRVGEVAFIGPVHFAVGLWVGVKFDEAVGKNDGTGNGVRYFECEPNHGSFVKPASVVPIEAAPAQKCCSHC
jgi:hypothetical protein